MAEGRGTKRPDIDLLRQLASAVASYRLFPGDPEQPGFQAAVERVRAAAGPALTGGPLHVDIRSGRFSTARGEIPHDDVLERFAVLFFERRVEHLHVVRAPTVSELVSFGEVLSLPVDEAQAGGGAGAHLAARGVTSIVVGEVAPEGTDDVSALELDGLSPDQLALWQRLQDPEGLAASIIVQGLPGDPASAAQDIYRRFRALHQVLPEHLVARKDLFRQIRRVLDGLPEAVAREFTATVMTRLTSDAFASDHTVALTDAELADALVDLSKHGGPDPMELGRRIAKMTDRKEQVVELIAARMQGVPDIRELVKGVRPTMLALSKSEDETQVRQAIADALAEGLVSVKNEDAAYVRDLYPANDADAQTLALLALRDYLLAETSQVSFQQALEVWAAFARRSMAAMDTAGLDRLLDVLDDPTAAATDVFRRDALARAVSSVPSSEVVRDLVVRTSEDARIEDVRELLRRFAGPSLESVMDLLATEEDRTIRAQLVGLAADLASGESSRVAQRLDDPRWYVVRNIATILGRVGGDDVLAPLVTLSSHGDATVRREVVRGLVSSSGSQAVPYLRRLADDRDASVRAAAVNAIAGLTSDVAARALADVVRNGQHRDDRHKALDSLATHASGERVGLLSKLAARREKPRLPRDLRRKAKKLSRAQGRTS